MERHTGPARATYTVEEAARVLGIGRSLAYALVRTGQLPALRIGRRLVVPRAALDRLVAVGGHDGAPEPATPPT
jgi:excisionase family DNA binding protein